MDCLTFFAKLIEHAAWPVTALAIVVLLRRELQTLIPLIKRFKAGPLEVELERVAKELEATKKVATAAEAKAEVVAAKLDETDEREHLPDSSTPTSKPETMQVTPIERQVLKAITESRFATRSVTGVAKDTGLTREVVQITYGKLIEKGLLEQMNNAEGRLRWYPTPLGRIVANEA